MKFGDKLIALRKKNGLSQEDLAGKLNVSRQSVSKWESNNTYPETDKIVQICNIFNCSMDDLINDKVESIEEVERKEKSNINIGLDSLLEFITKTIDMFSSMTFASGFKCLIELGIVCLILACVGAIGVGIIPSMIGNLVDFLPWETRATIESIVGSILGIIWFVICIIILVHVFKIRYLDYFDKTKASKTNEDKSSDKFDGPEKKQTVEIKKQKEIVIRDPKDQPFAFLSGLSKVVLWFVKFMAFCILFGFAVSFICLVGAFIFLVPFALASMLFMGADLGILGCTIINGLVVLILFNFIFDRKNNLKLLVIIFLGSLVLTGIGGGLGVLGFKNIEIIPATDVVNKDTYTKTLDYRDNMYIINMVSKTNYIIDNSIENNKFNLSTNYSKDIVSVNTYIHNDNYRMTGLGIEKYPSLNLKKQYSRIINELKDGKITSYDDRYDEIEIRANEETINKLVNNLSKIYLFDKEDITGGFAISNLNDKINIDDWSYDVYYDAVNDTLKIDDEDVTCERSETTTSQGIRVDYIL